MLDVVDLQVCDLNRCDVLSIIWILYSEFVYQLRFSIQIQFLVCTDAGNTGICYIEMW